MIALAPPDSIRALQVAAIAVDRPAPDAPPRDRSRLEWTAAYYAQMRLMHGQQGRRLIAAHLEELRKRAGLGQRQTERMVALPEGALARLERGRRSLQLSDALALAHAYSVSLEDLVPWPRPLVRVIPPFKVSRGGRRSRSPVRGSGR